MNRLSYKISPRTDIILKNGKTPVFIRLYIDGKDKRFKIPNIEISFKNWDNKNSCVKKAEPFYHQINHIINKYKEKTSKIILDYTIETKFLSFADFQNELYEKTNSNECFFAFAEKLIQKLPKKTTQVGYRKNINKLKEFKPKLKFSEINYDFIMSYKIHLKNDKGNAEATITKALAVVKMFLNEAIKRDIIKTSPFKDIKLKQIKGKHTIITKDELQKLIRFYQENKINPNGKREALRGFLFACFTGLRYGDVKKLEYRNIVDGKLNLTEEKTGHEISYKLPEYALKLINRKAFFPNQKVFNLPTNQPANRYLKQVAIEAGINDQITFHYARRTFGTLLYNLTGSMDIASKLLGHTNIKTTEGFYAQTLEETKNDALKKLNDSLFTE